MRETLLHPIYTLESLFKIGVIDRFTNLDETTAILYILKVEEDGHFNIADLKCLQNTFLADRCEVRTYFDSEDEKDKTVIELSYIHDILGVIKPQTTEGQKG